MKIPKDKAKREDWDDVRSWNYKLTDKSVIYAELDGEHGEVESGNIERIYYIIDGEGEYEYGANKILATKGDVITIPTNTKYNYRSMGNNTLKVLLFMELWNN